MHIEMGTLVALILYFVLLVAVGLGTFNKKENLEGYVLGGRQLGPWVTSMSAEASDMSGWMLMGLPGYAYMAGISAFWIAIGLTLGTWVNWVVVARRLRIFTQEMNNSITLSEYFENRFHDSSKRLRMISAVFIIIFFLIYTSSSFVAGAKLFNTAFGMDYTMGLFISAGIVVFYTLMGGFAAGVLDRSVSRLFNVFLSFDCACDRYLFSRRCGRDHSTLK